MEGGNGNPVGMQLGLPLGRLIVCPVCRMSIPIADALDLALAEQAAEAERATVNWKQQKAKPKSKLSNAVRAREWHHRYGGRGVMVYWFPPGSRPGCGNQSRLSTGKAAA
jgi:hypothetical protein